MTKLFSTLLLFIACFSSIHSIAQYEAKNWVLGSNLLFEFSEDSLVNMQNMNLTAGWTNFISQQSTTCISDSSGNLLFMATWHGIYDANCDSMPNGVLNGDIDLTQLVIVPRPEHPMNYYVLYPGDGSDGKIRYSEVDMNLNNGMGAVIPGQSNVVLSAIFNDFYTRITAVRHANGKDVWVVSHRYNSNQYASFLVTKDGIQSNPVISLVGLAIQESAGGNNPWNSAIRGNIKISPDGRRIAWSSKGMHTIQVADFNTETGIVSNPIHIIDEWPMYLDFSQDGNMLYIGAGYAVDVADDTTHVTQVNLIAGSYSQIVNSKIRLDPYGPDYSSAQKILQLGMDGKIYVALASIPNGMPKHGVIESPSLPGVACNYDKYKYYTGGSIGQPQFYDMPNFMVSYLDKNVFATTPCYGDTSMIYTLNRQLFDSIRWEINDPITGLHVFNNQDTIYHLYSQPGKYDVHCYRYQGQFVDDFIKKVQVLPIIQTSLNDTSVCDNSPITLSVSGPTNMNVEWYYKTFYQTNYQLFDSGQTLVTNTSGNYFPKVDFWSTCGDAIDTVSIDMVNINLDLGPDTISGNCDGNYYMIFPSTNFVDVEYYIWNTGSFDYVFQPPTTGLYTFYVSGYGCEEEDSVYVIYDEPIELDLGEDIFSCNDSVLLESNFTSDSILWLPGNQTGEQVYVNQSDSIVLQITNGCGLFSDTIYVEILETPELPNLMDTTICEGDSVYYELPEYNAEYLWSTGDTTQNLTLLNEGYFSITISNACGSSSDGFNLYIDHELELDLQDTLWLVEGDSILLSSQVDADSYLWNNGQTTESIWLSDTGVVVLTVENTCGEYIDTCVILQTIGIASINQDESFLIYPNPASAKLYLEISNSNLDSRTYSIYSMDGRLIRQAKIVEALTIIDIHSFTPGVYLLKLDDIPNYNRFIKL